ncbi:MAG: sensor domain-containing diguanylate cyclase [Parashewanella sp.]
MRFNSVILAQILLLALLFIATCGQVQAQVTKTVELGDAGKIDLSYATYVLDKENVSDLEHVLSESDIFWRQLTPADTQMIGAHHVWLKLSLTTKQDYLTRLLEVANPHLDHIEIYHFVNEQQVNKQVMGDKFPFSQRPIKKVDFFYPIEFKSGDVHTLYLKIDTEGSAHLPLYLWSNNALIEQKDPQRLISGLHLGVLIGIGVFSLFFAFTTRSFSYGYYSGYVLCMALITATISGFAYKYLWPQWPVMQQMVLPFLIPLALCFAIMLTEKILSLKKHNITMLRFCRLGATFSLFLCLVSLVLSYQLSLLLNINAVLATSVALMGLTGVQAYKGHKLAKLYAIGWGAIMVGAGMSCLSYLGIISIDAQPQVPVMIGLTLEIIIISVILAIRYNDQLKQKTRIQQKALVQAERIRKAREEALQAETKTNAQLESMVQERTLELEIAYRELNETHDQLKIQSSIDSLTGVKNRSTFDKRLVAESKLSRRQQTPITLLMIDIDKFKLINDTYGHMAGDMALTFIADKIQQELQRPSDIVARYGGEEFALILPATDLEGGVHVANRIRQAISEQSANWQGTPISLTVSVGVSSAIIEEDSQIRLLLEQADKALYHAKANGRNLVQEYSEVANSYTF